jgi:hypothetical protein
MAFINLVYKKIEGNSPLGTYLYRSEQLLIALLSSSSTFRVKCLWPVPIRNNLELWILWNDGKTPWTDTMPYRMADTFKLDNTITEEKQTDIRASS